MSMSEYPVSSYGLLIPREYENQFISALNTKTDEQFTSFYDIVYDQYELSSEQSIYVDVDDQNAEFCVIDNNNSRDYLDVRDIDGGIIIPFDKNPQLIGAAYQSISEIIDEMKDHVGDYLPSDFPYEKYIGEYTGIFWG